MAIQYAAKGQEWTVQLQTKILNGLGLLFSSPMRPLLKFGYLLSLKRAFHLPRYGGMGNSTDYRRAHDHMKA
jgi:hypothetical protein